MGLSTASWKRAKLGNVVSLTTGKLDSNAAVKNGEYPFFTCSTETLRTNTYSFDTEAVLLAGNNANGVYAIKYFHGKFDAYQRTYVVRSSDEFRLSNHFLYYALQPKAELLQSISTGAATKFLTLTILKNLELDLPPLRTQQRIISMLSAYDDLINNNHRRIDILEEMAQAIYREWFIHFRFPGHENGKMADSSLGRIPERWEAVTLRDVTQYINRGISPIYDDNSDTLVLNQRCIREGKINLELSRKQSKQVPQEKFVQFGDVLINSTGVGTLGRVAQLYETVENCTVDSHVTIARANKRVNLDYFGFHLQGLQNKFEHSGTGTTGQTELSRETIGHCDFLLPSMDLQNSFSDTVSEMRQAIAIMTRTNSNLRATRDLLLPRLISGEVDVSKLGVEEVTAPA